MMKIRKATNKDEKEIQKFTSSSLKKIFNSPAKGLEDLEDIEKNFEIFWIVKTEKGIIGTLGVKNEGDARLSRMYVKESERRKGFGKKLIKKALNYCKGKFKRIFLTTYPQMKSEQFYSKMGFEKFKQDERIWMEKILN